MPSNLTLLLSLLAGYTFIHVWHRSYFRAQSLDGHRLIFETALAGFVLFVPSHLLCRLFGRLTPSAGRDLWHQLVGNEPYFPSLVTLLVLAPTLAVGLNAVEGKFWETGRLFWKKSRGRALDRAVQKQGNALQGFLHEAASRAFSLRGATEETKPRKLDTVCLNLKDGKVYIGWVTRSPNLRSNDSHIGLVPVLSGYRSKNSGDYIFTTSYPIEQYGSPDLGLEAEDFLIVLPVGDLQSVRFFDVALYQSLFAEKLKGPSNPSVPAASAEVSADQPEEET